MNNSDVSTHQVVNNQLHWYELIFVNVYWLGINIASGIITPLLLPYLVLQFMPPEQKNTYLAMVRVVGLAVAMLVQPLAGMFSDNGASILGTHRWGRRRPFIVVGTIFNVLFLLIVGSTPQFVGAKSDVFFQSIFGVSTAYAVLLVGIVVLQISSNISHGALQGLIPDVVPANQRGRASGVKAVFELIPVFLVLFIGPLVDAGRVALTVGIIILGFILSMLITVIFVHEKPWMGSGQTIRGEPILRLVCLTIIFVGVTRLAVWLVNVSGTFLAKQDYSNVVQIVVVSAAGLLAMTGSIFIGVYAGASVGIGKEARKQQSFIWWVVNRLLFLAAVGSIQGFAQYYLGDVLHMENPATMTTVLMGVVALFLIPSALWGGALADRIGRKRLVAIAGIIAAIGAGLLLVASSMPVVILSGCIIGVGAGTFMATNWALGTDLVPASDAGRYLGISNLAGAGAGIVGAGIGGPLADYFNKIQSGLGYLVIFALYAMLFLLSAVTLVGVQPGVTNATQKQQVAAE
jgi:MFS family permease